MSAQSAQDVKFEPDFNVWSFNRRMEIFDSSPPIYWNAKNDFRIFFKALETSIGDATGDNGLDIWKDPKQDLILTERMCNAARDFQLSGSRKDHVHSFPTRRSSDLKSVV